MERMVFILSALIVNAFLGGPKSLYAPLELGKLYAIPGAFLRDVERKLNRTHRSLEQRYIRGVILVATVIAADIALAWLAGAIFSGYRRFGEILLLACLLPVRPTWDCMYGLYRHVRKGEVNEAKRMLEGSIWRHCMLLDEHGIVRAGVEILAVHFCEKIFAPLCWYLLLGLPGIFISKSLYLMVETLGAVTGDQKVERGFSTAAILLHFVMNYIPARLMLVLWFLAACFLPGAHPIAFARALSDKLDTASSQEVALWASATILSLSLGGPSSVYVGSQWLGTGTAKAVPADLKRALILFALLHLVLFLLLGLFL